jgi:general L-amino acid transport system substrate-binding protein
VRCVLFLLINAEEAGWSAKAAETGPDASQIEVLNGVGDKHGLAENWAIAVIESVGHYGEVFDRNVGKGSPLKLRREMNALWNQGGILYAPPMR